MPPERFWSLTPRYLAALWDRHRLAEERQDRRVARLLAAYFEAHRDREKRTEPFSEDEFMPHPSTPAEVDDGARWIVVNGQRVARIHQTVEQQIAIMRMWSENLNTVRSGNGGRYER